MYIESIEDLVKNKLPLKQIFQNKFTAGISKHEILKMKNDDILNDRDVEICKLLFKFHFATLSQIYDYLKIMNKLTMQINTEEQKETTINSIKSRLDKLVKNRVLNKFLLATEEDASDIENNGENFYCLDFGGKYLLESYSEEDTSEWFFTINLKVAVIILKELISLNFYISLLQENKDKLVYFEAKPLRVSEKTVIIPDFEFLITYKDIPKYFICEVVRNSDLNEYFPKKIDKYLRLINTNSWKKYYDTENTPILFFICEDDLLAQNIGRLVAMRGLSKYRLSSFERIKGNLSIAFMQYIQEEGKLRQVRLNMFTKQ